MIKRMPLQDITSGVLNQDTRQQNSKSSFKNNNFQQEKKSYQLQNQNKRQQFSLPAGNDFYAQAKKAEYSDKDLEKAEKLYKKAIQHDQRKESAIKDLAAVLHQQGKTSEACELLKKYREQYNGDLEKYDNLLKNLEKQITSTGNCFNRNILLLGLENNMNVKDIYNLFENNHRIESVTFYGDLSFSSVYNRQRNSNEWDYFNTFARNNNEISFEPLVCIVSFESYSKAKKTLESLCKSEVKKNDLHMYWVNTNGRVISKIDIQSLLNKNFNMYKEERKAYKNPFLCNKGIWNEMLMMDFQIEEDKLEPYNPHKEKNNWTTKSNFQMPWLLASNNIDQQQHQINKQILSEENFAKIQILNSKTEDENQFYVETIIGNEDYENFQSLYESDKAECNKNFNIQLLNEFFQEDGKTNFGGEEVYSQQYQAY